MIKVGITGQTGFIGTHLYNTLGLQPNKFKRIPFEDSYFQNIESLKQFVTKCDSIIHLAAKNRHNDPNVIYNTNINLVEQLISACELTNSKPNIIFSSSTQEDRDNLYGKSKKKGRKLIEEWALRNDANFTGLIIPNVFGPFGNPYYNSVVATYCYQLTHGDTPKIDVDGNLKLIYIGELIQVVIEQVEAMSFKHHEVGIAQEIRVKHTSEINVSTLLDLLKSYKENYFNNGIIPSLDTTFERNMFNTFVCYIDHKTFFPFNLDLKTDDRGSFVETVKLKTGGQISFSTTNPGITRGNHFHTRKAERFAVIKGKARIELRRIGIDEVVIFELDGSHPSFVDMPIWFTHNITNVGEEELYTIFWISEHFNSKDPDTFFETV